MHNSCYEVSLLVKISYNFFRCIFQTGPGRMRFCDTYMSNITWWKVILWNICLTRLEGKWFWDSCLTYLTGRYSGIHISNITGQEVNLGICCLIGLDRKWFWDTSLQQDLTGSDSGSHLYNMTWYMCCLSSERLACTLVIQIIWKTGS